MDTSAILEEANPITVAAAIMEIAQKQQQLQYMNKSLRVLIEHCVKRKLTV